MGTRFKLFVQPPFEDVRTAPEIVTVSSPLGSLAAGPSDDRMYVVAPERKNRPYGANHGPLGTPFIYLPPWTGRTRAPAVPDASGNFDHYEPGMTGFEAAHVFGAVRFTLDVWEGYLGQSLVWHFHDHYDRLEISLLPDWDNAQFGYGFLEIGSQFEPSGRVLPFSLDFDVIAHEVGHAIIYSMIGVPDRGAEYPEYIGFQESFSDCVSLIAAMHFPSVIDDVLEETRGNLYLPNRLARFSEFAPHRQLRVASNTRTMAEFVESWKDEHELSQPMTGAIFDILVDIFHEFLLARGLISAELENMADAGMDCAAAVPLQEAFDYFYGRDPQGFHRALVDARDVVGRYLAETLWTLGADFLDYGDVARRFLAADAMETGGVFANMIERNFRRRDIGRLHAGRRRKGGEEHGHLRTGRTVLPGDRFRLPRMSYRERILLARSISG